MSHQTEWESPLQEWELPGEAEWSGEQEGEEEYAGEYEGEGQDEGEAEREGEGEDELAYELLEITSEEELDQFLGKLVKGAGKFLSSGVGKALTGALKKVAKVALPVVGTAIGSFVAPGVGSAIGGKLGSMASSLLEAEELEALGEEEAELEAARRFVQLGRASARYASNAPRSVPPDVVARSATVAAARRYAPSLVRSSTPGWRDRRSSRLGRPSGGRPQRAASSGYGTRGRSSPGGGAPYGSGAPYGGGAQRRRPQGGRRRQAPWSWPSTPAWGVWGGDAWPVAPAWAGPAAPWDDDGGAPWDDDDAGTGFEFA